ncbi:MAG: helix-turn-helix transcriptional regulator [Kiritimatiellae bacterium]|nr:helix-turn-helix transcriptional regulator [Kiritimatiellia bacterium]
MSRIRPRRYPYRGGAPTPLGGLACAGCWWREIRDRWQEMTYYSLLYIVEGTGRYRDSMGGQHDLRPGTLIRSAPGMSILYGPPEGERLFETYIGFRGAVFDLWFRHGFFSVEPPVIFLEPVDYWARRIRDLPGDDPNPGPDGTLAQVAQIQTLLADIRGYEANRDSNPQDRNWLARARRLLEAKGAGGPTGLRSVARELGLSYEGFRKRFTRLAGLSPGRYRVARRIDLACNLLVRHALTNAELAETCGFRDEYHFSRRFREITGLTPTAFRSRKGGGCATGAGTQEPKSG